MGDSKRRKQLDPNYGQPQPDALSHDILLIDHDIDDFEVGGRLVGLVKEECSHPYQIWVSLPDGTSKPLALCKTPDDADGCYQELAKRAGLPSESGFADWEKARGSNIINFKDSEA